MMTWYTDRSLRLFALIFAIILLMAATLMALPEARFSKLFGNSGGEPSSEIFQLLSILTGLVGWIVICALIGKICSCWNVRLKWTGRELEIERLNILGDKELTVIDKSRIERVEPDFFFVDICLTSGEKKRILFISPSDGTEIASTIKGS